MNNTKGREADIGQLLDPLVSLNLDSPDSRLVEDYFKRIRDNANDSEEKCYALKLAKIFPEFKSFLVKLGWIKLESLPSTVVGRLCPSGV